MSGLRIEVLGRDPAEIGSWDRYASEHPAGTVYHLSAWRTIFETSFAYRSWLLMARHGVTHEVLGILPLYLVPTPFARRLVSVPFRDRGGVLWNSPEAFCALVGQAKKIMAEVDATAIELKTLARYPDELVAREQLAEHAYWVRSAADLRGMSLETFWKSISAKRRNVRRAQEQGLRFTDMTANLAMLGAWYELHLSTQKRLGLPPFPAKFFSRMFEELRAGGKIKLFAVEGGSSHLAACVVFLDRRIATYAYGASSGHDRLARPNDFLFFNVIQWLVTNGFEWFDMGSDAPSQENLLAFKKKWLASQETIPQYSYGSPAGSVADSSATRYALVRAVFRHLPRRLLMGIGTAATRYFG